MTLPIPDGMILYGEIVKAQRKLNALEAEAACVEAIANQAASQVRDARRELQAAYDAFSAQVTKDAT